MQSIPVQAVPSQIFGVQLGTQNCQISIYQKSNGLYIDLFVDNDPIIQGVLCENRNKIVRDTYLGFDGDLAFGDTRDTNGVGSDPYYTELGSRFVLLYLETADLATSTTV